jgi:DNA-directed RNA polymerase specialized sigma24 family protein
LASSGRLGVEEREILEILRSLDRDLFEIVWARFYFDVDWKELAEERNVTAPALRMRVRRAFSKLRQIIQEPA